MNNILLGYKGSSLLDGGYFFAPYIPLMKTPVVLSFKISELLEILLMKLLPIHPICEGHSHEGGYYYIGDGIAEAIFIVSSMKDDMVIVNRAMGEEDGKNIAINPYSGIEIYIGDPDLKSKVINFINNPPVLVAILA